MADLDAHRRRRRRRKWFERAAALAVLAALGAGAFLVLAGSGGETDAPPAPIETAPPSTVVAAPTPAPAPRPRPRSRVRVAAVGDIALNGTPTDGGSGLFAGAAAALEGDVVVGNLEGTLTTRGVSKCGPVEDDEEDPGACFAFRADPATATHFASAGFTVLNVANNHSGDFGPTGLQDTLTAVREAGMEATGHTGSVVFDKVRRSRRVRPTTVAVLGFAPYANANPLLDVGTAQEIVRRAAKRANVVVVTMHAGAEGTDRAHVAPGEETYLGERRGDVVGFSKGVIDAGADLVIGHGPHVLRGMEVYRGRLIAYSLGNFATHRGLNVTGAGGESLVLTTTLGPDGRLITGRIHPMRIASSGAPEPGGDAVARIRELSTEDFGAAAPRVGGDGAIRPR